MEMEVNESYWRKQAAPIIAEVLKETEGQDEKVIRKALKEAYPFGPREMHPYRIWNDEIKRQRGTREPLGTRHPKPPPPPDPRQTEMF